MRLRAMGCAALTLAIGCGDTVSTPPQPTYACVPDRAAWTATVRPIVERSCGSCHGDTPAFGAPYSLLDYDFLTRTRGADRPVDRMHARLREGTMPPAGTPAPAFTDAQSIVNWASCGAQTLTEDTRMRVTAPVFRAPELAPSGLSSVELRADDFEVPVVSDRYQCFTFRNVVAADQFIRRFDILIDHPEVLHHVVLFRATGADDGSTSYQCQGSPEDTLYTYTWAPGQDALQFPDGGLRIRPTDRYILQIHYNNSRELTGLRDRSGVRMMLSPPEGTEYGMVALGPLGFAVAPRSEQRVSSACTLPAGTRVLASMPHMHEIGSAYEQFLLRGGQRTPIIGLTNWRFESQYFYETPLTIEPGDRIETACTFNNTTSRTVTNGARTTDEMCFGFTYVTPPPPQEYCNEPVTPPAPVDLTYTPGMCSPAGAPADLPLVSGAVRVEEAAALTGGAIPDGRWTLTNVEYLLNMLGTPLGPIDPNASTLQGRGQVWTSSGRVSADIIGALSLAFAAGNRLERQLPHINFSSAAAASGNTLALTTECTVGTAASTPTSLQYEVRGDDLVVSLRAQSLGSVTITPRYTFRLQR